jgi:hypothetical protein
VQPVYQQATGFHLRRLPMSPHAEEKPADK